MSEESNSAEKRTSLLGMLATIDQCIAHQEEMKADMSLSAELRRLAEQQIKNLLAVHEETKKLLLQLDQE